MVLRIEALADAISSLNSASEPGSDSYKLRNPGLLKAFKLGMEMDDDSRRIFKTHVAGYSALVADLMVKCSGKSRSKLRTTSTLSDLLVKGYSQPATSTGFVLCFINEATASKAFNELTHLSRFME
jgi:hypothetical protein